MLTFSLQSGSNGNCIYVEAGDVRLLFDAGISGSVAEGRMRIRQRSLKDVDALIISHDHGDHVRGAGVFHRRFKFPVYMTPATHAAAAKTVGNIRDLRPFRAGDTLTFSGVTIYTIPTPHDAADGVAFVVEHDGRRLGILTDLGHPFRGLLDVLPTLDAVYLESNYDPAMLAAGPYHENLKARIRGDRGHLSNAECAELIIGCSSNLQWAALSHLSQTNNHPDIALDTHRRIVGRSFPFFVASRYDVGEILEF